MYENDAGRKGRRERERGLSWITDRRRIRGQRSPARRLDELLLSPRERTLRINRGFASGTHGRSISGNY